MRLYMIVKSVLQREGLANQPLGRLTFLIFSASIWSSLKRGPTAKREVYNASRFCHRADRFAAPLGRWPLA